MDPITVIIPPSATPITLTITAIAIPTPPVPPVPPVPPTPPAAKLSIGTNVPSNDPTSGVAAWCDVTKQMTGWYGVGTAKIQYDANGYPAVITPAGGQAAAWTYLYAYPWGTYKVAWTGPQTALSFAGATLANVVSDGDGGWTGTVQFNTGDRCEVRNTGGITALSIYAPDAVAGQVYRNACLALLKPYSTLRLMPMQRVNGIGLPPVLKTLWANRTPVTGWDQTTNEVAAELLAELCKEAGCVPWVCIPYGAEDAWITGMAKLFAQFPVSYWEYTNEPWNTGPAYQGNQIRNDAIAAGTYGSTDPNVAGARRAAVLASHMGSLVRAILPGAKTVFGGQATWNAWAENGIGYVPKGTFDYLAVAPYFQPATSLTAPTTVAQVEASCAAWINSTLAPNLLANQQVATANGIGFIAYEGGQSLVPSVALPNGFIAIQPDTAAHAAAFAADPMTVIQTDPAMGTLYDQLFALCRPMMSLFCHFMVVSNWGTAGYWGARQQTTDPENAKTQAITRAINA